MIKKAEGKTQATKKNTENRLQFLLEESVPKAQGERKRYVSDIAFFYSTIFKKKLEHFVGKELLELSIRGRTSEHYDMIRSNIYAFEQINTWMQEKTNEHLGNLEEIRDSFDGSQEIISNLKNKYGKN